MILPLRRTHCTYSNSRPLFNPLAPFSGKLFLLALVLLICGWRSLRLKPFEEYRNSKTLQSFSATVVGILTAQEFFDSRFGFQLSTFLGEILDRGGHVVVSVESGGLPFTKFMKRLKLNGLSESNQMTFFESKCLVGYSQLLCRSIELLRFMTEACPTVSWYIRIDDDTLLIPAALDSLLLQLNPRKSLAVGSPSFYFCTSPSKCTHQRFPGLPWKDIDKIVRLIRGGAGYVLSYSVIEWIVCNQDQIITTAEQLESNAEDLAIFYALRKHMPSFDVIQARSFFFERPEVSLRYSPLQNGYHNVRPISFHMHHDLVNGYSLYRDLNGLRDREDASKEIGGMASSVSDVSSQALVRVRSQLSLRIVACMQGMAETKGSKSLNRDSTLLDVLVDMMVLQIVKEFDLTHGRYKYDFLMTSLEKAAKEMKTVCHPGMYTREEKTLLETRMARRSHFFEEKMKRRVSRIKTDMNLKDNAGIQIWLGNCEREMGRSSRSFENTIDLLVDCHDMEKRVSHKIDAHRRRKKSLWKWNGMLAIQGYARARMNRTGLFWQKRYVEYMSYLRDNWEFEEYRFSKIADCRRQVKLEELDLVMYLRRARVILTEIRQHHLALSVLQIPHVYIYNEDDTDADIRSVYCEDLAFVKCVCSLTEATEALAEFLLGEEFFNQTWHLPTVVRDL